MELKLRRTQNLSLGKGKAQLNNLLCTIKELEVLSDIHKTSLPDDIGLKIKLVPSSAWQDKREYILKLIMVESVKPKRSVVIKK